MDAVAVAVGTSHQTIAIRVGQAVLGDVINAVVVAVQVLIIRCAVAIGIWRRAAAQIAKGHRRIIRWVLDAVAVRIWAGHHAITIRVGQAALDDVIGAVVVTVQILAIRHTVTVGIRLDWVVGVTKGIGGAIDWIFDAVTVGVWTINNPVTVGVFRAIAAFHYIVNAIVVAVQVSIIGCTVTVGVRRLTTIGVAKGGGITIGCVLDAITIGVWASDQAIAIRVGQATLDDVVDAVVVTV